MTICYENGCNNEVTTKNSFVPALADIAAAAGKLVVNLTAEDLLLFATCEECVALHEMCGDDITSFCPVENSLRQIARRRQQQDEIAKQRVLQAEQAKELALRKAANSTLGAKLLGLGFKPTVSEFVRA